MRKMRIELGQLPYRELSPNVKVHWGTENEFKILAVDHVISLVNGQGSPTPPYAKAIISLTFVVKTKRRRDMDNLIASCKSYIDGLVRSGVIVDDSIWNVSYAAPKIELGDKENTIIEIEEVE